VQNFNEKKSANVCNKPHCNCQNSESIKASKARKSESGNGDGGGGGGPIRSNKKHREEKKKSKNLNIGKSVNKSSDANFSSTQSVNSVPSRLEKAKNLARKQLRLNISSDPLTPISSSSLSPQSVKSVLSPTDSPFINHPQQQHQHQQSAFSFYPYEVISSMFPFYMSPFTNSVSSPAFNLVLPPPPPPPPSLPPSLPTNSQSLLNNDPNYLQNLLSTIYSLANYQHIQQLQSPSLLNPNLIYYSIQQQLLQQQQQQQKNIQQFSSNVINNQSQDPLIKKQTSQPINCKSHVKSKLISYINESEIENKVNEHFRRSLGSKYIKISHKLNRINSRGARELSKPKQPISSEDYLDSKSNNEFYNLNSENSNKFYENDSVNEALLSGINEDDEETFIEYPNDSNDLVANQLSPASTVSLSEPYSSVQSPDENHLENDETSKISNLNATNEMLLYSPASSNFTEPNY